jgi:hypothetical protein
MTQMRYAFFYALIFGMVVFGSGCSRKADALTNEPAGDVTGSPNDPPIDLKCELKPDVRYSFHLETDNTYRSSKWKFGTDSQETHFETDYRLSVTNITKSKQHKLLDVEFLALVVQVFVGDESKLYYDSDNHAVPMVGDFADAMGSMIHRHFGTELSRKETLVKVSGLDEAVNSAIAKNKLRRSDGYMRRMFSTTTVRHMVELNRLPEKTVRVGDKWHQTDDLDNGLQADANYTFRGYQWRDNHKYALIEVEGTIASKAKSSKSSLEDTKFLGRYWFDPEQNIVAESVVHEAYTWSKGKGPDGEKFPTTQTISLKLDSITPLPKAVATN